jgi:hypothetical protein
MRLNWSNIYLPSIRLRFLSRSEASIHIGASVRFWPILLKKSAVAEVDIR